jgi:hypothetical protein
VFHGGKDTKIQKGNNKAISLFGWLVADGWCWFVLREEYCWLVAGGWFVLREKYYWLVADKPSEHGKYCSNIESQSTTCGVDLARQQTYTKWKI